MLQGAICHYEPLLAGGGTWPVSLRRKSVRQKPERRASGSQAYASYALSRHDFFSGVTSTPRRQVFPKLHILLRAHLRYERNLFETKIQSSASATDFAHIALKNRSHHFSNIRKHICANLRLSPSFPPVANYYL